MVAEKSIRALRPGVLRHQQDIITKFCPGQDIDRYKVVWVQAADSSCLLNTSTIVNLPSLIESIH